jgi:hypothetical protein
MMLKDPELTKVINYYGRHIRDATRTERKNAMMALKKAVAHGMAVRAVWRAVEHYERTISHVSDPRLRRSMCRFFSETNLKYWYRRSDTDTPHEREEDPVLAAMRRLDEALERIYPNGPAVPPPRIAPEADEDQDEDFL